MSTQLVPGPQSEDAVHGPLHQPSPMHSLPTQRCVEKHVPLPHSASAWHASPTARGARATVQAVPAHTGGRHSK